MTVGLAWCVTGVSVSARGPRACSAFDDADALLLVCGLGTHAGGAVRALAHADLDVRASLVALPLSALRGVRRVAGEALLVVFDLYRWPACLDRRRGAVRRWIEDLRGLAAADADADSAGAVLTLTSICAVSIAFLHLYLYQVCNCLTSGPTFSSSLACFN